MRRAMHALLSVAFVSLSARTAAAQAASVAPVSRASDASEAVVKDYIALLQAKQWDHAAALILRAPDSAAARLESSWTTILAGAGDLQRNRIVRSTKRVHDEVVVALDFRAKAVTLHFVLARPGLISNVYVHSDDSRRPGAPLPDYNVQAFMSRLRKLGTVVQQHGSAMTFAGVGPKVQCTQFSNYNGDDRSVVLTYTADATEPEVRLEGASLSNPVAYAVTRLSSHSFLLTGAGVESVWTFHTGSRGVEIKTAGYEQPSVYRSDPETVALFEAAVARNRDNARIRAENAVHEAAAERREKAEAEREDRQRMANGFNKMLGDLSAHAARESQTRANADAMVARIAAEQAAAREQRQARDDAQARASERRRQEARQAATVPPPPVAAAQPGGRGAGGALTISTATRPVATDRGAAPARDTQAYIGCSVLKPGAFDQHKGAVFFSAIRSVTVSPGQPAPDRRRDFLQKVRAAYNLIGGHPGCWTGATVAEVQRRMDDMASSYRTHKKVNTGIAP